MRGGGTSSLDSFLHLVELGRSSDSGPGLASRWQTESSWCIAMRRKLADFVSDAYYISIGCM